MGAVPGSPSLSLTNQGPNPGSRLSLLKWLLVWVGWVTQAE
jgi:hypothetical protein